MLTNVGQVARFQQERDLSAGTTPELIVSRVWKALIEPSDLPNQIGPDRYIRKIACDAAKDEEDQIRDFGFDERRKMLSSPAPDLAGRILIGPVLPDETHPGGRRVPQLLDSRERSGIAEVVVLAEYLTHRRGRIAEEEIEVSEDAKIRALFENADTGIIDRGKPFSRSITRAIVADQIFPIREFLGEHRSNTLLQEGQSVPNGSKNRNCRHRYCSRPFIRHFCALMSTWSPKRLGQRRHAQESIQQAAGCGKR